MNTKSKKDNIEGKKISVEIIDVDFRNIDEAEINANEMDQGTMRRLVKNLKRDGVLTSTPLIMKTDKQDMYICISGHHRIKAAIKAGILHGKCMVIDKVDKSTRIRLQLSHNDINGTSNEEMLAILQAQLNDIDMSLVEVVDIGSKEKEIAEKEYDVPEFSYINICLLPDSREELVDLIMSLEDANDENWIISEREYDKLKDLLSVAFERGFKTPGQAMGKFLDIIKENENLINR
jgi:uncharacterized ParB-like nuclease family protein